MRDAPKVSIFYAHSGAELDATVETFATRLRADGVDAKLDVFVLPAEGWIGWMDTHVHDADYLIVICGVKYHKIVHGKSEPGEGRGVLYEYRQVAQLIYEQGGRNAKVIPVGFSPGDRDYAPPALTWAHYYDVSHDAEYRSLVQRIFGRIPSEPPLGRRPSWATAAAAVESESEAEFEPDRFRLRERTKTTLGRLSTRTGFSIQNVPVSIERTHLGSILNAATAMTPTLVIGDPGSGKSALLQRAAEALALQGHDVIFFDAAGLDLGSNVELKQDLRISHDLDEIFLKWSGEQPGYLFVDSLDSARTGKGAESLRSLISRIASEGGRWNVVASIRQYDLRYDVALQRHFNKLRTAQIPAQHTAPEFERLGINHIYVGPLLNAELDAAKAQSPALAAVMGQSPPEFIELLRNPLSLSLVAELLATTAQHALVELRTQLELLDLWWKQRVLADSGDQLERILRSASTAMLKSRSLFARRDQIADVDYALKQHLLSEYVDGDRVDRYRITFPHNLLFDYAVERLLLRGNVVDLIGAITGNRDAAVLILPSLRLHARHLWELDLDRRGFWDATEMICGDAAVPDVVKATIVAFAAEDFGIWREVRHLVEMRSDGSALAFSYFIRALIYLAENGQKTFLGKDAPDLSSVLEYVSHEVEHFDNDALLVLDELTDKKRLELAQPSELSTIGSSARRILNFAFSAQFPANKLGRSIRAVVKTYSSDPAASRMTLSQLLQPGELDSRKAERAKWLTFEIAGVVDVDPDFVAELFERLMAHDVISEADERVNLSNSQILGMFQSLKDDYSVAIHSLGETLPALLKRDFACGTRAVAAVLERQARSRSSYAKSESVPDIRFNFLGHEANFRSDYGQFWDSGQRYGKNEAIEALDQLFGAFRSAENADELRELLAIAGEHISSAAFWRRLVLAAADDPAKFAEATHEIMTTPPLLWQSELYGDAAFSFLRNALPELTEKSRAAVVSAIESLPTSGEQNTIEGLAAHLRPLLLEALRDGKKQEATDNSPVARTLTDEEIREYRLQNFKGEAEAFIEAVERAEKLWMGLLNQTATKQQAIELRAALDELFDVVPLAKSTKAADNVWNIIGGVTHRIVSSEMELDDDNFDFLKTTALQISHAASPRPDAEHDAQFDRSPSWGAPIARIEAYETLQELIRRRPGDADILEALFDGTRDESPVVRHQLALGLASLAAPNDQIWRHAEPLIRDKNRGVLWGVVAGAGRRLGAIDLDRWSDAVCTMFETATQKEDRNHDLQLQLATHIVITALSGNAKTLAILRRLLTTDFGAEEDARGAAAIVVAFSLNKNNSENARAEARSLLEEAIAAAATALPEIGSENVAAIRRRVSPANTIVERLFFDAGAFEPLNGEVRDKVENFWRDYGQILEVGADFPFATTVNNVVQISVAFAEQDPVRAFRIAATAIRSGQAGNYQFDFFAITEMVKLVRLYLARYHELLESNDATRRELVEVVDIFARAGWPQAIALVFELRELYR
jgi:hypothetical protein